MKVLVLSSTRKERDGIAEYTRQLFNPSFFAEQGLEVEVTDLAPASMLAAPFRPVRVIHIQHEFFMFDRLVGLSALFFYPYLWFWCWLLGRRLVTTIHSTYNVDDLPNALPHFSKYRILFPACRIYLKLHFKLVVSLSARVFILSKVGSSNLRHSISQRQYDHKVVRVHLGNYTANYRMQHHGLLAKDYGIARSEKLFTLFGFAWPNKGYEYGIQAMDVLVNQRRRQGIRLIVVSGEASKASFPGGGQGESYIGYLKRLTRELRLEEQVIFTGYLANDDPLLEEIFADTFCFLFPYLNRNFPSGAISTVLATRKPILVSQIPCFDEYERLLAFEEKNPVALADKMVALMDDPHLLDDAVQITKHNAETFAMGRIFTRHVEVYQELTRR
jgi:glycosyltransferase involved in cell wall biosynthesis